MPGRGGVGYDFDAGNELLLRCVLEQEPAGARAQRLVDVLVEVERREHEHTRPIRPVDDPTCRFDTVELGHAEVHEHDVGLEGAGELDRLEAVPGFPHYFNVVLGPQDHAKASPHERLVVGEQDADHSAVAYGSRARTANPPTVRRPASKVPP